VLARGEAFIRRRLSTSGREELLDAVLARCAWVRIFCGWRPGLPDEGDNHLMELAIAGGAGAIVTRNRRDLTRAEPLFPGLAILNPDDVLARVP
jgi:predicted nucleic acid-binding protein